LVKTEDFSPNEIVYSLTSVPENGTLSLNGEELYVMSSFTQDDIDKGRLKFQHDGGETHIGDFSFIVSIGISQGDCKDKEGKLQIEVTPTNDLPKTTGEAICKENSDINLQGLFVASDEDGSVNNEYQKDEGEKDNLWLRIASQPEIGKLMYSTDGSTWAEFDQFDTWYKYNDGKLTAESGDFYIKYVHDGSESTLEGKDVTSFKIYACDINPWAEGVDLKDNTSIEEEPGDNVFTITISPINDQPMIAKVPPAMLGKGEDENPSISATITGGGKLQSVNRVVTGVKEGEEYKITANDTYAVDKDNTEIQRQYIITKAPKYGIIYKDGQQLTTNSTFSQEDINNGKISYIHYGDEPVQNNGITGTFVKKWTPYGETEEEDFWYNDFMEYRLSDAVSGITEAKYMVFKIQSKNDYPIVTTKDKTISVFGPGCEEVGSVFSVTDPDLVAGATSGAKNEIYARVYATDYEGAELSDYAFETSTTSNDYITVKYAENNSFIEFYGTIEAVNSALKTICVKAMEDRDKTDDKLCVTTDDQLRDKGTLAIKEGFNGGKELDPFTKLDTKNGSVTLRSSLDNDAPELKYPEKVNINEDCAATKLGSFTLKDADGFALNKYTLKVEIVDLSTGKVSDKPTLSVTELSNTTLDEINEVLNNLTIKPVANFNGEFSVKYTITDFEHGATGKQTVEESTKVTVKPINDNPVITIKDSYILYEGSSVKLDGISFQDKVDLDYGAEDKFTVTLKSDFAGDKFLNGTDEIADGKIENKTAAEINEILKNLVIKATDEDKNGDKTHTVTVTVDDLKNGNESDAVSNPISKTAKVYVSSLNDAPYFYVGTSTEKSTSKDITMDEDKTLTFTGENLITIKDDDFDLNEEEITITATNSKVTFNGTTAESVTLKGKLSQINKALAGLKYTPDPNYFGTNAKVEIEINDKGNIGVGLEKTSTFTANITVNNVNDQPVLGNLSLNLKLDLIDEDKPTETGTAIKGETFVYTDETDIVAGVDKSGPATYFAVVANNATATQGTWQAYMGGSWVDIPTDATATSAYIYPIGTSVRFNPAKDYNTKHSTVGTLDIKISDGNVTYSEFGKKTTISSSKAEDTWSKETAKISQDINPINDAPIADNHIETFLESQGGVEFNVRDLGEWTDVDNTQSELSVYKINGNEVAEEGTKIEGSYGTLTVKKDGTFSYVLKEKIHTTDLSETFTYTITDGMTEHNVSNEATVTIKMTDQPEITIASSAKGYMSEDASTIQIPVDLSYSIGSDFDFNIKVTDGSGISGTDFTVPATVTFANGKTTIDLPLEVLAKSEKQYEKAFKIEIESCDGKYANLGENLECNITLINDIFEGGVITVKSPDTDEYNNTKVVASDASELQLECEDYTGYNYNSYQWYISTDGGAGWNKVKGAAGKGANLTTNTVPEPGITYYYKRVSNWGEGDHNDDETSTILKVTKKISLKDEETELDVCKNQDVTLTGSGSFTINDRKYEYMSYQWYKGTGKSKISGETGNDLTISKIQSSEPYYLVCSHPLINDVTIKYSVNVKETSEYIEDDIRTVENGKSSITWTPFNVPVTVDAGSQKDKVLFGYTYSYPTCSEIYRNLIVRHNANVALNTTTVTYGGSVLGTDIVATATDENGKTITGQGEIIYYVDGVETATGTILYPSDTKYEITYKFVPSDKSKYTEAENSSALKVNKKQLTIGTAENVEKEKVYDGNTSVKITKPATMTGFVYDDEEHISVTTTAKYEDPQTGEGKTINIKYELTGDKKEYYIWPETNTYNDGKITKRDAVIASNAADTWMYGHTTSLVNNTNMAVSAKYDGADIAGTYKYYIMDGTDKKEVTGKYLTIGTYDIIVEFTPVDLTRYTSQATTKTIEVTKRPLTVETTVQPTKVYDGETGCEIKKGPAIVGLEYGDKVSVSVESSNYKTATVGDGKDVVIKYTWSGADLSNYTYPETDAKTANITKAETKAAGVTITQDLVYGAKVNGSAESDLKIDILDKNGKSILKDGTIKYYYKDKDGNPQPLDDFTILDSNDYTIWAVYTPDDSENNESYTTQEFNVKIGKKPLTVTTTVEPSKVYDGGTDCAITSGPVISGIIGSDDVKIDASSAAYNTATPGDNKPVTVTYTWSGADLSNYTYPASDSKTASITKAVLAEGSDISTLATIYGAKIDGTETGDIKIDILDKDGNSVLGDGSIVYYYEDKNGNIKTLDKGSYITPGDYKIWAVFTPTDSEIYETYTSTKYNVKVGKKQLEAITEVEKTKSYDGNTDAKIIGSSTLSGIIGDDDVAILKETAQYDNAETGENKTITVSYTLIGANKNYYIAPAVTTYTDGEITKLDPVVASGADTWTYGHTTSCVNNDNMKVSAMFNGKEISGTYKYYVMDGGVKNEMTNKHLPVGDYSIIVEFTPTESDHYTVQEITKEITVTPRALTVETNVVASKVYDGTDVCAIDGDPSIIGLEGIEGDDDVTVSATAAYDDENVGENKPVSVTYTWSGADLDNYTYPTSDDKTASITKAVLAEGSNISTENTIYGAAIDGTADGDITITILDKDNNDITADGSIVYYTTDKLGTSKPILKGDILVPGEYPIYAVFTPTEGNYETYTTTTYNVTVGKKQLVAVTTSEDVEKVKPYDGNTSAKVNAFATLDGIIGTDDVAISSETATYDNAETGENKTITYLTR